MNSRHEVDITVKLDPALLALLGRLIDAADRDWDEVNRQLTVIRDRGRAAAEEPPAPK